MAAGGCLKKLLIFIGALLFLFVAFVVVIMFVGEDDGADGVGMSQISDDRDSVPGTGTDAGSATATGPVFIEDPDGGAAFDPDLIEATPDYPIAELSSIDMLDSGSGLPGFTDGSAASSSSGGAGTGTDGAGSAGEPRGIGGTRLLFDITYTPSEERQGFRHPEGLIIGLPPYAAPEPVQLQVRELQVEDVPAEQFYPGTGGRSLLRAWEVDLGDIHRFDELLTVTLPFPPGYTLRDMSAEEIIRSLSAVSFNRDTGFWQPEPASFDEDGITVYLDHLTAIGVTTGGPALSSNILSIPADADTEGWNQAVEAAWVSMNENLGIAGQAGNFSAAVKELPFLESLNNSLGYLGTAAALMDITDKVVDGKTAEANLAAMKAVLGWAMGKIAITSVQIASLGTFFIDYSLSALAQGALGAQEEALAAAYRKYYENEGWTTAQWYDRVSGILENAKSPDAAQADLKALIDSYTKKIWADEGALVGYLSEIRGHGWTADAGLDAELKAKLEQDYMRELSRTLEPVFLRARSALRTKLYAERFRHRMELEVRLKLPAMVWIDVAGLRKGESAQAALFKGDSPYLRARPSKVRADFYCAVPMERLLTGDVPDRLKIRVTLLENGQEVIKTYSRPFRFEDFSMEYRLDIDTLYERGSSAQSGSGDSAQGGAGDSVGDFGKSEIIRIIEKEYEILNIIHFDRARWLYTVDEQKQREARMEELKREMREAGGNPASLEKIQSRIKDQEAAAAIPFEDRREVPFEDWDRLEKEREALYEAYIESLRDRGPEADETTRLFEEFFELHEKMGLIRPDQLLF